MVKNIALSGCICFTVLFAFCDKPVHAQSPFIDQVPQNDQAENSSADSLELKTPARVVMRSNLGVVLRGDMLSISESGAMIVTDRARLRNPDGVEYKFTAIQSLNIPEHDLYWSKGNEPKDFLKDIAKSETIEFTNLTEFLAENSGSESDIGDDEGNSETNQNNMSSNNTVIRMQPVKKTPTVRPTVTIICGNCEKEVSLSSDSGQECPHCHVLWESSPLDAAALADLKAAEEAADRENSMNSSYSETTSYGEDTLLGEPTNHSNVQNSNTVQEQPTGLQPVNVPPPIQHQSQPQELTLENLPLWLKITVFGICFGIMYYAIFVR